VCVHVTKKSLHPAQGHHHTHPGCGSTATVTATKSPSARPDVAASRPGAYTCAPCSTASPASLLTTTSRPPMTAAAGTAAGAGVVPQAVIAKGFSHINRWVAACHHAVCAVSSKAVLTQEDAPPAPPAVAVSSVKGPRPGRMTAASTAGWQ
jgi:hypothetical protein